MFNDFLKPVFLLLISLFCWTSTSFSRSLSIWRARFFRSRSSSIFFIRCNFRCSFKMRNSSMQRSSCNGASSLATEMTGFSVTKWSIDNKHGTDSPCGGCRARGASGSGAAAGSPWPARPACGAAAPRRPRPTGGAADARPAGPAPSPTGCAPRALPTPPSAPRSSSPAWRSTNASSWPFLWQNYYSIENLAFWFLRRITLNNCASKHGRMCCHLAQDGRSYNDPIN